MENNNVENNKDIVSFEDIKKDNKRNLLMYGEYIEEHYEDFYNEFDRIVNESEEARYE